MSDLFVGIGLVLVIEGLIWALVPTAGIKMLVAAATTPQPALRLAGLASVAIGVGIVWAVRG